jgi:flagellar assembly protein FliH
VNSPPTSVRVGVLRNVSLQQVPHALARPGPIAAATPAPAEAKPMSAAEEGAALREQALAEGYRQGAAAGARQFAEERAAMNAGIEQARRAGFEEGRADGLRRAQEEAAAELGSLRTQLQADFDAALQDRVLRLQSLASSLEAERQGLIAQAEEDLVALVHELVCRMLAHQAVEPDHLRRMAAGLVKEASLAGKVRVHVHPDDYAMLAERGCVTDEGCAWEPDVDVRLGGVRLRSSEASLDARLETQMARLGERLAAVRVRRVAPAASTRPDGSRAA